MARLLVEPSYGLANRLLALVSGIQVAEATGRQLAMYWHPRHKACSCPFDRLFTNVIDPVSPQEIRGADQVINLLKKPKPPKQISVSQAETVSVIGCGGFWLADHPPRIREYLNRLQPLPWIQGEVGGVWRKSRGSSSRVVGLHIRATDHRKARRISTPGKFLKATEELIAQDPSVRFLVCTDEPKVELQLHKTLGDRMFSAKKRAYDRTQRIAIEDALVDLLLLARTESILGSIASTYSRVASIWGQAPLTIIK
jgi:hypothetical protein